MPLVEDMEASGKWLFRWRSYLPIAMFVLIGIALVHFAYLFGSHLADSVWEFACLAVGAIGLVVRGMVAGYVPRHTSGRNTREQVAGSLNTTGMYSVVRNPLYLGNFFMALAVALFLHSWWLPLIYTLAFALYYERIILAEESFLQQKFGAEYTEWARRTPAFIPRLSTWQAPALPFSWRTAIRREYQSAYGLVASLFALELISELRVEWAWRLDPAWVWVMGLSTAAYLGIRLVHKTTRYFYVDGR